VFAVGSKVVHPAYGAGTVVKVEDKQIGDQQSTYYVIDLLNQNGTLMVPVARASELGLRLPIEKPKQMFKLLATKPELLSDDHRKRQELIDIDIKSGNVVRISEAVRDLAYRNKVHRLTEADTQLFNRAQDFLAGELALSQDVDLETARDQLRSALDAIQGEEQ
jgi:CarD family transcriptional regulator